MSAIKEWVQALRSGKYKQLGGALCKKIQGEKQYCCLGVLSEVVYGAEWEELDPESYTHFLQNQYHEVQTLSEEHAVELGLDQEITMMEQALFGSLSNRQDKIPPMPRLGALIHLNDSGVSFEQIADIIERCGWDE